MPLPLEHRHIATNGITLHTVLAGPAQGDLVILLHGFPECWRGMDAPLQALAAAGYRVAAPDLRGYGLSDKPHGVARYALDVVGNDVLGLITALGHQRAHVIGHDWGAMVTWWLALAAPDRLGRVAVLNVPHPAALRRQLRSNRAQLRRSWYMLAFQLPFLPEFAFRWPLARLTARLLTRTASPGALSPAYLAQLRAEWARPGAATGMLNWYRAALRHPPPSLPDLRVRIPLLLLWGVHDVALNRTLAEDSRALCDAATVEYLEDATHWLIHDEPARVCDRLVAWVRGHPGPPVTVARPVDAPSR